MTVDLVIENSHIVLPSGIVDKNLIVDDGKIIEISHNLPSCDVKINGSEQILLPGLIDTHVHYGVYSPIDQAGITESHAAAIGGITTMMRMIRLGDSLRTALPPQLKTSENVHYIDYALHASIFNLTQVEEMSFCKKQGVTSFKLYMNLGGDVGHVYMDMAPGTNFLHDSKVHVDLNLVEKVIETAATLNCPVLIHAEDYESCACGIKTAKEKKMDGLEAWSKSRSPESEVKAIESASKLARKYDCVIYFVHIGSKMALDQIQLEKSKGTKIFVETCPHYLTLSHEKQNGYAAKVMPPIRSDDDIRSVWSEISTNHIDTIGTDHVANQIKLKLGGDNVWDALAGFPGIGTLLPLLLHYGVNSGKISLNQLSSLTSTNAAKIFGMYPQKGFLGKNADADITLVDLKKEQKVSPELFGGFSDYLVYDGWLLKGWPVKTIVRGKVVMDDGQIVGTPNFGKLVPRATI